MLERIESPGGAQRGQRKEVAIRGALGGSRWKLIQEQMTESLLIAIAGGAVGWLLSFQPRGGLPRIGATCHALTLFVIDGIGSGIFGCHRAV